ncbi:MAG TPA: cation-translocating P-type ATPase [Myxococcota bacterium]|nr:cation-translocating P-type ATPase [Myxococcota bacterium]
MLAALGTTPDGLTPAEAASRLAEHGPNALPEGRGRSRWRMLLDQFTDFMILVLVAAGVVSAIVGEPVDSLAIVVIVLLNGAIGFAQELRAQNAMAALRKMAAHKSRVRRGAEIVLIDAHELVPGDIVLLEAGDVVPADLRLIEVRNLACAEAALTGESVPVTKTDGPLPSDLRLGDRHNMAFKGTLVTSGRGVGAVVATATKTELGKIARLLDDEDEVKTPLQKRLAAFGMKLAWAVLAICLIVFVAGLIRGEDPALMFLTAVSLAVAAIPEALPAVVVISLALGAARMVREQALIRRLPAVETLGSVTYVCSDKTGTLTQNKMRVEETRIAGEPAVPLARSGPLELLEAMVLANDVEGDTADTLVGDPTEVALVAHALSLGVNERDVSRAYPRLAEVPFDSRRMRMSTAHRRDTGPAQTVLYMKGAPEAVLSRCHRERVGDDDVPLPLDERRADAEDMAARGLRVLAIATRTLPPDLPLTDLAAYETDLTLLGLVGLIDPPRDEARDAVLACKSAGLTPVMITGDHPATALAIARALGIGSSSAEVLTGDELARLGDADFAERVPHVRVYARVDPEQKIRIVKALQERGELVAMTGDGVNDAPALKRADIGVAMGKGGTEVAREAAHMVLLDDNFATIARAIKEGRRIFDNIRKFIKYTMTSNAGELWTILLAPFLGLPIPLLPVHILWINLVTDGLPGLALTAERPERDVMSRPPRHPRESIFAHGMWQHIVWVGLTMAAVVLITQAISLELGAHWQTMAFTVLCLSQLGHAMAIRSERDSVFSLPNNRFLTWTVLGTVLLQLATIYLPVLHPVFKTDTLTALELLVALGASSIVFFAVELEKWAIRRFGLYGERRAA